MAAYLPRVTIWLMAITAVANAGVVSHYRVNGQTIWEGATFDEVRAVAGDPVAAENVEGNSRRVAWMYLCSTAGSGPCTVVSEDAKREMRVRFQRGRLKIVRFASL